MMKSYVGRKATIFNKAKELSTLCNVDVLLILYGPDKPNIPQVWCSKPDCMPILDRYSAKNLGHRVQGGKKEGLNLCRDGGDSIGKLSLEELKKLDDSLAGKIDCLEQRINMMKAGPSCSNYMNNDCDLLGLDDLGDLDQLGCNYQKNNSMIEVDQGYNCNSAEGDEWMGEVLDWVNSTDMGNYGNLGFDGISYNHVAPYFDSNLCINVGISNQMSSRSFDELGSVVNHQLYSSLQHADVSKQNQNCSNNDLTLEEDIDGFELCDQMWPSSSNNCDNTELMLDISDPDDIKFGVDDLELMKQFAGAEDPAFVGGMFC